MSTATGWFRFLGMNINDNPVMSDKAIEHDLSVAIAEADVVVLQEFRFRAYWRVMRRVVAKTKKWRASPGFAAGIAAPTMAAQGVLWRSAVWKRKRVKVRLLHKGKAKISEARFIRAVLLKDKDTGLLCWFLSTHFVVGGDQPGDGPVRVSLMRHDLRVFNSFLLKLAKTGHPVIGQLDANIRPGGPAYRRFMAILGAHDATTHGEHGIEFLFTMDGDSAKVEVLHEWTVAKTRINTPHEGRGVTARLVRRKAA